MSPKSTNNASVGHFVRNWSILEQIFAWIVQLVWFDGPGIIFLEDPGFLQDMFKTLTTGPGGTPILTLHFSGTTFFIISLKQKAFKANRCLLPSFLSLFLFFSFSCNLIKIQWHWDIERERRWERNWELCICSNWQKPNFSTNEKGIEFRFSILG